MDAAAHDLRASREVQRRLPKSARSYGAWAAEAMAHRFCVVARGDFPGTPKLGDHALFGAAGGCLPLVVLDSAEQELQLPLLPFRRFFDWCEIAYLTTAGANFTRVLERLRRVTAAEAARKHA